MIQVPNLQFLEMYDSGKQSSVLSTKKSSTSCTQNNIPRTSPKIFNLLRDPFELADIGSNTYTSVALLAVGIRVVGFSESHHGKG